MSPELISQALFISLFGMAVVVAVLLALWGFMAVLVRVTADAAPQPDAGATPAPMVAGAAELGHNRRAQAAAAAVAVALALDTAQDGARLIPPPISPWQATLRGNVLSRRAGAFRRQPPAPRSDQ